MTKREYLQKAFEAFNNGRVDADTYSMCMNAGIFCDEDEEDEEWTEQGVKN